MTRVHPGFPIIGSVNLTAQFSKFVTGQVQRPLEKWLAIINVIFAIGARYSRLIQAEWKGDERDHLIYFTRARLLSINTETLFEHPDLQSVQTLGLMSFYFLSTGQMNRSWTLNGTAIRWATSLGINLRNDSTALKDSLKEIRYRVWWSLYTMELRLRSMQSEAIFHAECGKGSDLFLYVFANMKTPISCGQKDGAEEWEVLEFTTRLLMSR